MTTNELKELSNDNIYVEVAEMSHPISTDDDKKFQSLNWSLWALIIFIVCWVCAILIGFETKTNELSSRIIHVEATSDDVITDMNVPTTSYYIQEKSYNIGAVVVVKHHNITGVILRKSVLGGKYVIVYKNHEGHLLTISLPVELLLRPIGNTITPTQP